MATEIERGPGGPDGLRVRNGTPATEDKLAILRCYVAGFVDACKRWGEFNFVDGFAGPGVDHITEHDGYLWGSPMIAAHAQPQFRRILAVDFDEREVKALRQRAERFGDRVVVAQGDSNIDLVPLMEAHIDRRQPTLCLLDPEAMNLKMSTVEAVSRFRVDPRNKTELLILFPSHMSVWQMFPRDGSDVLAQEQLDDLFGTDEWRGIRDRRVKQFITPEQQRTEMLALYQRQLEALGYTVQSRLIKTRGHLGRPLYHLFFATSNAVGAKIMKHCFDTRYEARSMSLFDGF